MVLRSAKAYDVQAIVRGKTCTRGDSLVVRASSENKLREQLSWPPVMTTQIPAPFQQMSCNPFNLASDCLGAYRLSGPHREARKENWSTCPLGCQYAKAQLLLYLAALFRLLLGFYYRFLKCAGNRESLWKGGLQRPSVPPPPQMSKWATGLFETHQSVNLLQSQAPWRITHLPLITSIL